VRADTTHCGWSRCGECAVVRWLTPNEALLQTAQSVAGIYARHSMDTGSRLVVDLFARDLGNS
jgi:hypothetical protein